MDRSPVAEWELLGPAPDILPDSELAPPEDLYRSGTVGTQD